MTPIQRVQRVKVQLHEKKPFFGYIIFLWCIKEVDTCPTMSITQKGLLSVNPKWVGKLCEASLTRIFLHEVMHIVLQHHSVMWALKKCNGYNHHIANLAADSCVEYTLCNMGEPQANQAEVEGAIVIKGNDAEVHGMLPGELQPNLLYTVQDMNTKSMKQVYWELLHNLPKDLGPPQGDMSLEGIAEDGESSPEEVDKKWKQVITTAAVNAKQKGNLPSSLSGLLEDILEPKVPWQTLLRRFVVSNVITDTTWKRPSRKSASCGVYLPSPLKSGMDIILHMDTSGSVYHKLDEFLSELYWILQGVQGATVTLILCDCAISSVKTLTRKDLQGLEWKKKEGGGGTSHRPVVEWIRNNNKSKAKVFISLTDGESDIERCYRELPSGMHSLVILPEESKGNVEALRSHCTQVLVMD